MFGNKSNSKFYRTGGTRGGQDQFKWDDVKNDKYRENYLGHSVHATVGRWQKGKDLTWYAKSKGEQNASLEEERRRLRELDEDLMNEALGIRAEKKWNERETLDAEEVRRLLAKGQSNKEEEDGMVEDRGKGLGAGAAKFHDHLDRKTKVQVELEKYRAQQQQSAEEESRSKLAGRIIDPSKDKKGSYSADDITAPGVSLEKPAPDASSKDNYHRDSRNRDVVGSSSSSSRMPRDRVPQEDTSFRGDQRPREVRDRSRSRDRVRRDSRERRDETRDDRRGRRRSPSGSRSRSPPRRSGDSRERRPKRDRSESPSSSASSYSDEARERSRKRERKHNKKDKKDKKDKKHSKKERK